MYVFGKIILHVHIWQSLQWRIQDFPDGGGGVGGQALRGRQPIIWPNKLYENVRKIGHGGGCVTGAPGSANALCNLTVSSNDFMLSSNDFMHIKFNPLFIKLD